MKIDQRFSIWPWRTSIEIRANGLSEQGCEQLHPFMLSYCQVTAMANLALLETEPLGMSTDTAKGTVSPSTLSEDQP